MRSREANDPRMIKPALPRPRASLSIPMITLRSRERAPKAEKLPATRRCALRDPETMPRNGTRLSLAIARAVVVRAPLSIGQLV